MQQPNHKKLLFITLAATALTLSACGKKNDPALEGEPAVEAQTSVEQEATGVATADASNGVAVASADDGRADEGLAVDSDADLMNGNVGVATADESEILDGSESEEHISTY